MTLPPRGAGRSSVSALGVEFPHQGAVLTLSPQTSTELIHWAGAARIREKIPPQGQGCRQQGPCPRGSRLALATPHVLQGM